MRHLICIILIWIVMLPAIIVVCYIANALWLHPLASLGCLMAAGALGVGVWILTEQSWIRYKLSGHKITITSNDVLNAVFLTAGVSAVVALVSGLFNFDSITMPSLCVFAGAGVVCFLIMFIEMLLHKD